MAHRPEAIPRRPIHGVAVSLYGTVQSLIRERRQGRSVGSVWPYVFLCSMGVREYGDTHAASDRLTLACRG